MRRPSILFRFRGRSSILPVFVGLILGLTFATVFYIFCTGYSDEDVMRDILVFFLVLLSILLVVLVIWRRLLDAKAIGALLGVVLGVYLKSVVAGLVVALAGFHVDWAIDREKMEDLRSVVLRIRKDPDIRNDIEHLVEDYFSVKDLQDKEFIERARNIIRGAVDDLSFLAEGRLRIESMEEKSKLTEHLKERCHRELRVSSWEDPPAFWETREADKYVEATKKAIKERGIKVTRIFVVSREEFNKQREGYHKAICKQIIAGIDVKIAFIDDQIPEDCVKAYVIYDDHAVRTEETIHGTKGNKKRATLSIDPNDVELHIRLFRELDMYARPYHSLLKKECSLLKEEYNKDNDQYVRIDSILGGCCDAFKDNERQDDDYARVQGVLKECCARFTKSCGRYVLRRRP